MKGKTFLALALVFAAGAVLGAVIARSTISPRPSETSQVSSTSKTSSARKTNFGSATNRSAAAFSMNYLAELRAINGSPRHKRWELIRDIAKSVPPGEEAAAIAAAQKELNYQEASNFRWNILQTWAERDHQAVLAYSSTLKNRNDRSGAQQSALTEWAKTDVDAALAWVKEQPPGQQRQLLEAAVLRGLAQSDPERALEKLEGANLGERRWVRNEIITALAETKPQLAAELALKSDRGSRYNYYGEGQLGQVMQSWFRQDPAGALAWFESQPESVRRKTSVLQAIQTMSHSDPESGVKLLEKVPNGQAKQDALNNLLANWGHQDADALKTWVDSRTDPNEKKVGQAAYAQALATTDPQAAAQALRGLKLDERQSFAYQQVYTEFAQRDPQAALAMAKELTDTSARNKAIAGVLSGWAHVDPVAASQFALTLPGGPAKNQAISQF